MKLNLHTIKTIIFDLGGVVIDLDIPKSAAAFARLGNVSAEHVFTMFKSNPIFMAFERGEISAEVFRDEIRRLLKSDLSDEVIDIAWNAMLLDIPQERITAIGKLRDRFDTLVLSNTNQIHASTFDQIVAGATNGGHINDYFNKVYYSHILGMRKPDVEIFEFVLDQHNLEPATTLFIDDLLANTTSASTLGIQVWHLSNQQDLLTVFDHE